jgi:hypothetical protein
LAISTLLAKFDIVKRSLTLVLLFLFSLNIVGYYGVFIGIRLSGAAAMREQFDTEKYLQEEVLIKVPITIPYAVDARDYERVDGEFEHQGQVYRLVKQKLASDTLYIVCVKDSQTQKINQVLADYVKSYTDKPIGAKSSTSIHCSFLKDFVATQTEIISSACGWGMAICYQTEKFNLTALALALSAPPPKA